MFGNDRHLGVCLELLRKGEVNELVFKEYLTLLKQKQIIKLALEPHPEFGLSRYGFVPVPRRQYRYKNINNKIPIYENNSGYQMIKIEDIKTFNLCMWKTLITDFFGSPRTLLKMASVLFCGILKTR